jgi:hypothetical protein
MSVGFLAVGSGGDTYCTSRPRTTYQYGLFRPTSHGPRPIRFPAPWSRVWREVVFERVLHLTQGQMIVSYVIAESIAVDRVWVSIWLVPKKGLGRARENAVTTDHSRDRDQRTIRSQRRSNGTPWIVVRLGPVLHESLTLCPQPAVPGRHLLVEAR